MEIVVAKMDDRITIYDTEKKVYEKFIRTNYKKQLRVMIGLRKNHGENAYYMSNLLRKNEINTFEVVSYTKNSYVTKEIIGENLFEKIIKIKNDRETIEKYIDKYMNIIKKILELKIYYTDFRLGNFIINSKNELYIIDIDEMYDSWYYGVFKKKRIITKLKRTLKREFSSLRKYGIDFNENEIYKKYIK